MWKWAESGSLKRQQCEQNNSNLSQNNVYSWNNIVFIVLAFDNLSLLGKRVRIHPTVSATKKNSHICFANICIMDKRTVAIKV